MAWDVVVVGAGAAGLLAATRAAELGRQVLLLEKNQRPGVKILMSGGTRCNLTHATDARGIIAAFGANGKFLHSALAAFSPADLVALVEAEGVATKVEPTGKVFPASNKASDVLQALLGRLKRSGCTLALGEPVTDLARDGAGWRVTTTKGVHQGSKLVVTTGGQSYPGSGTTGDGYDWARRLGHQIIPPRPALTPITSNAPWIAELRGITVPDVGVCIRAGTSPRPLVQLRGSMLFAHFGLSGPVMLDASRVVSGHPQPASLALTCDFLPAMAAEELDGLLRSGSVGEGKKHLASILAVHLPRRLAEVLIEQAGMDRERKAAGLARADRQRLVHAVKRNAVAITGTLGFEKAEVTAGGVSLAEVDSRTMESKLVPGLYFAGEILDLDGPIGGYNFQAAFSTGWLAGATASR